MPKRFKNKSEESAYNSVHMWLYRNYGKATRCEKCDNRNYKKLSKEQEAQASVATKNNQGVNDDNKIFNSDDGKQKE